MIGTARDLLLQHWQEEKRIASHFSRIMRTRIWLSFGVPLFYALFSPHLEAALAVFAVLAAGWIVRREFVSLRRRVLGEFTQQLDRTDAPELWGILDQLQDQMGIQAAEVSVIVSTRNYGDSPSVIDVEGRPRLVVPLGFFKMLGRAPGAAKAMLAHELAHVVQHDTKLWLLATAYLKGLKLIFLPFTIFAFLAVSLTSVMWMLGNKEQPEYTRSSLPTSQEGLRTRNEKADVITQPILAGLQILLLLAFARGVRQMRNRSEQAADLAAVIFLGG
jgi:Zn-dependent protease with chaperone function